MIKIWIQTTLILCILDAWNITNYLYKFMKEIYIINALLCMQKNKFLITFLFEIDFYEINNAIMIPWTNLL